MAVAHESSETRNNCLKDTMWIGKRPSSPKVQICTFSPATLWNAELAMAFKGMDLSADFFTFLKIPSACARLCISDKTNVSLTRCAHPTGHEHHFPQAL